MSRHGHTHLYFRVEREGRVAQMSKQEEVIARKRQEILEKQKTTELAKQVVAAQSSSSSTATAGAAVAAADTNVKSINESASVPVSQQKLPPVIDEPVPPKNNFNNDGSFFENFKKITEAAAKKAQEEKQKQEKEEVARKALEDESTKGIIECPPVELNLPNLPEALYYSPNTAAFTSTSMSSTNPMASTATIPSLMNIPVKAPQAHFVNTNSSIVTDLPSIPPPPPPPPVSILLNAFPTPFGAAPMPFNSMSTPVQQIPTPNSLSLNKIPPPRDLDLTAIPEPQMNIECIKMPIDVTFQQQQQQQHHHQHQQFHHQPVGGNNYLNEIHDQNITNNGNNMIDMARAGQPANPINSNQLNASVCHGYDDGHDNNDINAQCGAGHGVTASISSPSTSATPMTATSSNVNANANAIPTTIDDLIEFIAISGDQFEEKIISEITQMNEPTLFRFLIDKSSLNYQIYREKVKQYRSENLASVQDKYDPEDLLQQDDIDAAADASKSGGQLRSPKDALQLLNDDCGDEYDSDSEYMHEAKERNLENMKRKIDSGSCAGHKRPVSSDNLNYYSTDDDDTRTDEDDHMEMYKQIQLRESALHQSDDAVQYSPLYGDQQDLPREQTFAASSTVPSINAPSSSIVLSQKNRKKRSRWGEKVDEDSPIITPPNIGTAPSTFANQNKPMLSAITRSDTALLNYARQNYGTINLSEEDWKKCEDHYKVNLLYQDMLKKRDEIDRLARSGKFKYEYDSDEDTVGGTWEHKLRNAEMEATAVWAEALNQQSKGKHHIGDFLPPEELKKFMEKYNSQQNNREPDLSDYKEYKLKENNKGFQMLQKLGWKEGQGLGFDGAGIVDPINKAQQRDSNQGLGSTSTATPEVGDNEYDAYRKRMMLAYRFRPNPMNNPRRAYY